MSATAKSLTSTFTGLDVAEYPSVATAVAVNARTPGEAPVHDGLLHAWHEKISWRGFEQFDHLAKEMKRARVSAA